MADRIGQQLGNYRLTRLIGQGGFGEVYLGRHIYLDTLVAVKMLYMQLATTGEAESFLKEARTIAQLKHPNIIRVLDFAVQEDVPFLVMDLASNGTLRQRYPQGSRLPLENIVTYVKQVASALQYAHDQQIIHRDVKPENMLIGRIDEILLSDFGVAVIGQSTMSRPTQEIVGTISYMAPEQFNGKPSRASDQYALGIVVYEWLCGSRPFEGSNFAEVAFQHLSSVPPSLRRVVPNISPDIERVVLKALEKDPHLRFARVQEFADALEEAYKSVPPRAALPGTATSPPTVSSGSPHYNETFTIGSPNADTLGNSDFAPPFEQLKESLPKRGADILKNLEERAHELSQQVAPLIDNLGKRAGELFRKVEQQAEKIASKASPPEPQHQHISPGPSTMMFPSSVNPEEDLVDFFIIYNNADRTWAEWIAWQLEEEGYSTILPHWDFRPGSNFEMEMQKAAAKARRTIITLSSDYLNARSAQSAWVATFGQNATSEQHRLLPICVRECRQKFRKLLELTNYIDIVGKDEATARAMLLEGIHGRRIKPTTPPDFPGDIIRRSLERKPSFPDKLLATLRLPANIGTIRATSRPVSPSPTSAETTLTQQIEIAFTKQDWPSVIRKVDMLIKRNPDTVPPTVYHMQGRAFLEEGDLQRAYDATHIALTMVTDQEQRLTLLKDCADILALQGRWDKISSLSKEALKLSPGDPIWLEYQQQALIQAQKTKKTSEPAILQSPSKSQTETYTYSLQHIEVFFSYSRKDEPTGCATS